MSTLNVNTIRNEAGTGAPDFPNGVSIPATNALPDPENRIINGAFDFWQRGTGAAGSGGYVSADRWRLNSTGGTFSLFRGSFTAGQTLGSNNPAFFGRFGVSGQSGTQLAFASQRIEDVRSYAGQTITVLGWAKRFDGSGNMFVQAAQNFGTGGSPSATVGVTGATVTLTTDWQPFAVTMSIPSITGKTIGSDGNSYLSLEFYVSNGNIGLGIQTINVDLWGIHIKRGTHTAAATEFYKAPELGPELARSQRYYYVQPTISWRLCGTSAGGIGFFHEFPTTMRGTPTLGSTSVAALVNASALAFADALTTGFRSEWVSGNSTIHSVYQFGFTADAEL
jgi:hypothetical protein